MSTPLNAVSDTHRTIHVEGLEKLTT
ncbi:hypothetical protein MICRO80W_10096 [Micrococcus luteus]|nr:hypothetical protein MICRO80W_10096 [Micrococcus luteus]